MFFSILFSVFLVSLVSFVGIFFLALKERTLDNFLELFISFAVGSMLGDAFIHILPEATENLGEKTFLLTVISFLVFFVLEKFLYWRHCHLEHCQTHPFTYLSLIGDTIHNFIDGTIIAASFLTNFSLGITTTLAVIFHEIPQEIGDFSILIYGGLEKKKAIFLNFLSALSAFLGALLVYFFFRQISGLIDYLLPFAAGNFLYLSGTDIIPELREKAKNSLRSSLYQFILVCTGLFLMWLFKQLAG